ncbi:porin [Colwellia sp. 4_MG-2023]|jgi:hypothetical protein|uniref:porin n=1 Tax=unclassified Colwellia TaxID=196834 RepID=UPI001C081D34|nr:MULTISPECIES: porin [unclassified Colwellia]MBU2924656.1 porin [Colwellia sp. C2M11]MDO6507825.1 porin [Colwellia sp. 5_MG-2023]MDO6556472.1 porin [Colwellia sp. 4_MG-2023]MDO6653912.1 porin [Colwellia sp. 3_MG-2023]MDO6666739.1 porin [Colwellia sp. 2_MG-2023]
MKHNRIALALTGILLAGSANAEITLNGFASIVAGVTTASDESLYGYDDSIDFSPDSLFALQASSDLGEGLSITAQILSRGADDWDPKFEWAYVGYQVNDNLKILAGRQRIPFYMYSDFLDVSYAYPWITPPRGVYDVPFDTFDGIAAIYSTQLGDFDTTLHAIYGGNNSDIEVFDNESSADFTNFAGASLTLTRDWLTLRGAYFQTEMNIDLLAIKPLVDGWNGLGQNHIASQIDIASDTSEFIELGFQLDFDQIIIVGEYSSLSLDDTALPDQESYYLMAGYRFNNMMVHVTYGVDEDDQDPITLNYQIPGIPDGTAFESLPVDLQTLIYGTESLDTATDEDTSYITLGLRWDFHQSAALKFEYTSFSDDLDSNSDSGLFRTALVTVF